MDQSYLLVEEENSIPGKGVREAANRTAAAMSFGGTARAQEGLGPEMQLEREAGTML